MTDQTAEVVALREQLAAATAAARDAFRDTTRLIRLLSVLGEPASPEHLVDQVLVVLSEVFFADVVCVAQLVGDRLMVSSSCGLAEDDPAFVYGWPAGEAAQQASAANQTVTRHAGMDLDDLPESVRELGIQTAVWTPLNSQSYASNLLILFRSSYDPFTKSDLQLLSSVSSRLRLAVEERERSAVIERLANFGHQLARHLDPEPLLDEAVEMLRQLAVADRAWVVTLDGEVAHLRAHRGLSDSAVARWPCTREKVLNPPRRPGVLGVPVLRDGSPIAWLFVGRQRPRPFAKDSLEIMTIFANYLGVALTNAQLYLELAQQATRDPLTGLANRSVLAQQLGAALGRRGPTRVGLLFCDLDGFKAVNDRLGHEAGDELLQQVAARLRRRIRTGDLLARFGGDEFVIVVDSVTALSEVAEVGDRICQDLHDPFIVRGEQVTVSASIGGVLGVRGQTTASVMLRDADAAMYAAKAQGPGQIEVFDDAASHRSLDRLDLRSELPYALERGELSLHYQPIVSFSSNRILAFEALLRWNHPHHGAVAPDVFIPLAEDTGAIIPIGRWVLREACEQLARWHTRERVREDRRMRLSMSVNVSPIQLHHPKAAEQTLDTIRGAGLDPGDVWLEVTENSYLRHDVTEYVTNLRTAGVHFALDDFGTAYSNLSYLQRLPIEILKIDKSFISEVPGADLDLSIVSAVLGIADSLGLAAIAEGIETPSQLAALVALGCRTGQGFQLGRPMTAEAATELLVERDQLYAEATVSGR